MDAKAGWMSVTELAAHFGVNAELLRGRLKRLMKRDWDCFREIADPGGPKYVFSIDRVRGIIQALQAARPTESTGACTVPEELPCGCMTGPA